jgi:hypothetical protein
MRKLAFLLALATTLSAHAQVWEKYIAPGLTYRMELDTASPRMIHALKFNMHSDQVRITPELANLKVYGDDKSKGRETVSELAKRTGAIAAINGDYFPYTGRPVGLMVRSKELISSPYPTRAEFAWGKSGKSFFGASSFTASFKPDGATPIAIDSVNDECKPDSLCLDTDTGAFALTKSGTASCAVIRLVNGALPPDGAVEGEVLYIYSNVDKMPIQLGNAALVATGSKAAFVAALHPGDRVTITTHTGGFDWNQVDNCIGGGPYLLRRGNIIVDAEQEGFKEDFYGKRHPRTAIGRTAAGDIWLVVVDGRQSCSIGATLDEMAQIMEHFGCTDAINLDGGGSSTFNLFGLTVNRPSEGSERAIANALLFYGPAAPRDEAELKISVPATAKVGDKIQLSVTKPNGEVVPNSDILWSGLGAGWLDQGGLLRVVKDGTITISAVVHGQTLSNVITAAS